MATGYQKWPSALAVIQDVCGQLGLPVPAAGVTAPDDQTAQQMLQLLNWAGRRLVKPTGLMRWSALKRTWTLTTVPGTKLYDLPDDWDSFIDLTAWNKSSTLPMLGPTDAQWATLQARQLGATTVTVVYRVRNNQFELYTDYSSAQTLLIDYSSRGWVCHLNTTPVTYGDKVTDDADELLYDNELITAKLKLAFLTQKGFDTTAAQMEYNEIEEQALCADADAPALSTSSRGGVRLISTANLPDTGYG